ncbi:plastocyanin/azurin family copper-binding protein [Halorubellus litoreus]|uniref:Plastocyanin/azurin family copper-binding protein n=1 Tax=Halorubellus litoreus TaxID=755308 RepID=A0ABD5VDQ0_9EURY
MNGSSDDDRTLRRRDLLGSAGVAVVTASAGCFGNDDGTQSANGENAVVVGPGGSYAFEPSSQTVAVGDTVTWTWDSANHNIVVSAQPDGADWTGTDGDGSKTYDTDHVYEYTFETAGTYEYYCQPHEGLGMVAEVVVEE